MTDPVVALKLTGDASGLKAATQEANAAIAGVGATAQQASAQASTAFEEIEAQAAAAGAAGEAMAQRIATSMDASTASMSAFLAEQKVVQEFMATEAQSLDDVSERRVAYNEALQSGVLLQSEYKTAVADLEKQEASLTAQSEKYVASMGSLADKYSGASSGVAKLENDEAKLNQALASGAISAEKHAAAIAGIAAQKSALADEAAAAGQVSKSIEGMGVASAGTAREIGVLAGEGVRGNFTRMEGSVVTLTNRLGLMGSILSPVGLGIIAIAGGIAMLVASEISSIEENDKLNASLLATNGNAGQTVEGLRGVVDELEGMGNSAKDAEADVLALSNSGKIAGIALNEAALGASALADLTGEKIEQAAKEYEKLADDPVKALSQLNDKLHLVDSQQLEVVASAEAMNNKYVAGVLAIQAVAAATAEADAKKKQFEQDTGFWEKYNLEVNAAVTAEAGLVDEYGREKQVAADVAAQQAKLSAARNVGYNAVASSVDQYVISLTKEKEQLDRNASSYGETKKSIAEYQIAQAEAAVQSVALAAAENVFFTALKNGESVIKASYDAYSTYENTLASAQVSLSKVGDELLTSAEKADKHTASIKAAREEQEKMKSNASALDDAEISVANALDKEAESNAKVAAAQTELNEARDKAHKLISDVDAALKLGNVTQEEHDQEITAANLLIDAANAKYRTRIDLINLAEQAEIDEGTALDKLFAKYAEEEDALTSIGTAHQREVDEAHAAQEAEKAWAASVAQALKDGDSEFASWLMSQHDGFLQRARDHADYLDDLKQEQNVLHEWSQTAQQDMGQFASEFAKDIIEGGSVMHDLGNLAKEVVEQIIAEFAKLAVINPILNAVFGMGLPTMGTAGGALGLLLGNGGGGAGGGTSAMSSLGGMGTLWNGAQNVYNGASNWLGGLFGGGGASGMDSLGPSLGDYSSPWSGGLNYGGEFNVTGDATQGIDQGFNAAGDYGLSGGSYGGYSSGLGQALGIAGGAYAGINEFNNAGGGIAGAAGGLAYGAGTYFAGAGVSAALSGGMAAGLAAIPVVGWVAIGAMVLDKLTGGGLFGTAWKPTGNSEFDVSIGGDGADTHESYEEKKKKALFQGSKTKNVDVDVDQQTVDAFDKYFTNLQTVVAKDAGVLNEQVPDIIEGSFKETLDKKGNITSQISTILGQTFSESLQDFQTRELADNILQLLPASQNAMAIAAAWQSSATDLLDGTQMLFAAQVDINNGMGLLGGDDGSLSDIADVVEELRGDGETMLQTYARLQGEVQSVSATMDELGLSTGKTGKALVEFIDQATQDAGGLDNLTAKFNAYYNEYYSPGEIQNNARDQAGKAKDTALTAIGEDPNESMEQFRADFAAAMPTLTPEELNQWLDAANVLAQYTNAVNSSAQAFAKNELALYNDDYINALANAVQWEKQQIDTANELAEASGRAGASQQDLAEITQQGNAAIGKAFAQLIGGIDDDIQQLGGLQTGNSDHDLLMATSGLGGTGPKYNAQQAQQTATAYDLIEKLGDYAFGSGETVQQAEKDFGLTSDFIARKLGIDDKKVEEEIQTAKDNAEALTKLSTNSETELELLQNLIDVQQGNTPTFNVNLLSPATAPQLDVQKPGARTGVLPSQPTSTAGSSGDVATAVTAGTDKVTNAIVRSSQGQTLAFQRMLLNRGVGNRNERTSGNYRVVMPL